MSTTLINTNDNHYKFWNATMRDGGSLVVVRWGRIGTNGQGQVKMFRSNGAALQFVAKKINEKRNRGYVVVL
jgi:predicted DNA-binding WGR domain protein